MTLAEFLFTAQQVFGPFIPLLAVVLVVACLFFGIFFASIVMILRRI